MLGQQRDVARPVAKRRKLDVHHVDAVIQVPAEPTRLHLGPQVVIGRQDYANVGVFRFVAAERLKCPLLKHAKQLHLQLRRSGGNFVQEDGAALGSGKPARLVGDGVCERASHVAEQLAFQQGVRQSAAGHLDERLVAPRRVGMDRTGDEALAGSRFAGDKDSASAVGYRLDKLKDLRHADVRADEVVEGVPPSGGTAAHRQLPRLNRPPHRPQQRLPADRLAKVIAGPATHRLDRLGGRTVRRHQYHARLAVPRRLAQQLKPVAARQVHLNQDELIPPRFQAADAL